MSKRIYNDDGLIMLAAAVVNQAVKDSKIEPERYKDGKQRADARRIKEKAINWLMSKHLSFFTMGHDDYIRRKAGLWQKENQ